MAIAMPMLLVLVLVSVHLALWFHARQIVTAAAQEAARSARAYDAADSDGYARAEQILTGLGTRSVTSPTVAVTRGGGIVTATVTGHSPVVIPGLVLDVSATSRSPIEEFTP
ncbi:MAG: pilus assembly protein [Acidimicrobiales bacterium]|nr:pilus assembly protein [Acidimicrobiales bacterium]